MTSTADRRTGLRIAAGLASFLLISLFVVQSSQAAFTATDTNVGNAVETTTIAIDDGASQPLFHFDGSGLIDTADLVPGKSVSGCTLVDFSGPNVTAADLAAVQLAATAGTASATDIRDLITVEVDLQADCSGSFGTAEHTFTLDTGLASVPTAWTPLNDGDDQGFHFRVTLDSTAGDSAMGQTVTGVDVTWTVTTLP